MSNGAQVNPQAAPDPATTKWVPVGPSVVGPQGPPGPASTVPGPQGPSGPAGAGVPTPVVDGQWIKGSGGVAVWAGITQGDLPGNIGARTAYPPNNDLNQITDSGWYNGSAFGNAPDGRGDWLFVFHITHVGGSVWSTQICWTMQSNPVEQWFRTNYGGTWQPWVRSMGIRGQFYCGPGAHATIGGGFYVVDVDGDHTCIVYFNPALSYTPIITVSGDDARTAVVYNVSGVGFYCRIQSQGGGYGQMNVNFHAMPPSI